MTPDEAEEMREKMLLLSDAQIAETLESLAGREIELLRTDLGGGDLREITLWNIAILCAAHERLRPDPVSPDQTTPPLDETPQGQP